MTAEEAIERIQDNLILLFKKYPIIDTEIDREGGFLDSCIVKGYSDELLQKDPALIRFLADEFRAITNFLDSHLKEIM